MQGMKEDAVEYALESKDYDQAAALVKEIGHQLLSQGSWNQLLGWYERLPAPEFLSRDDLWLTYFVALINSGDITAASQRISEIKAEDSRTGHILEAGSNRAAAELAAVQGVVDLHSKADPYQANAWLKLAHERLAGDVTFRFNFAVFNLGVSHLLLGEIEEARAKFEESAAWGKRNEFSLGKVMGTSYLAETIAMTGNLRAGEELFQDAVRYVHEAGLQQGAVFSKANLGMGSLYYEWNKLEDAFRHLTEGIRLAEQGGYLDQLLFGYAALARAQNLLGDAASARGTIRRARRMTEKYGDPPIPVAFINAIEADLAQQRGDLFIVDTWVTSRYDAPHDESDLFSQYGRVVLARALAAKGNYQGACDVIRPMREFAFRQGLVRDAILYDVLTAKNLYMNGEPRPAMAILSKALSAAEPNRFVRVFLDEGGVVISMLKQILASPEGRNSSDEECSPDYLYFLLGEVARDTVRASTGRPVPSSAEGLEPLTDRELYILRLLEAGHSNKHIARELNISLNTVKYHLKNIYGKLGVVNRTQAARSVRTKAP
jgi:LuxR family maltose regulon positive regulatory protein